MLVDVRRRNCFWRVNRCAPTAKLTDRGPRRDMHWSLAFSHRLERPFELIFPGSARVGRSGPALRCQGHHQRARSIEAWSGVSRGTKLAEGAEQNLDWSCSRGSELFQVQKQLGGSLCHGSLEDSRPAVRVAAHGNSGFKHPNYVDPSKPILGPLSFHKAICTASVQDPVHHETSHRVLATPRRSIRIN